MERLEAALQKARQDRQVSKPAGVADADASLEPVEPVVADEPVVASEPAPVTDIWQKIKQIKLSPRIARNHRISTLKQGRESAPYDLLRTRTMRTMGENGWVSLAITSPNKTCGKTTVCTNLALSLVRQADLKVIVLDLDLRRPAMHKILAHRPEHSLHEVLRGTHPIESAFVCLAPNLAIGLNNSPTENPSELLQSNKAHTMLEDIKAAFDPDLILFDMPPMSAGDENVGFLPKVDCALLVTAAGSTTMHQLDVSEKELSGLTNVLGIVLNKCRFNDSDSGYNYDYY